MSDRNYLSISEVLGLLKDEFPDITISKIRFLESQGLIAPERTPSGYRKFFDPDVGRLRWILRQQKDKFLPLRVIKGRLEGTVDAEGNPLADAGSEAEDAEAGAEASCHDSGVELTRPEGKHLRSAASATPPSGTPGAQAAENESDEGSRDSSSQAASETEADATVLMATLTLPSTSALEAMISSSGESGLVDGQALPTGLQEPLTVSPVSSGNPANPVSRDDGSASVTGLSAAVSCDRTKSAMSSSTEPNPAAPSLTGSIRRPAGAGGPAHEGSQRKTVKPFPESLRRAAASDAAHTEVAEDTEMTAEELRTAAGIDRTELSELEKFDLVRPVDGPAGRVFRGVDLRVARLAVAFRQYGIEPRHLRSWRNSADREAGLFEQTVTPLLLQRSSEAHEQAKGSVRELARLSEDLHDLLLTSALSKLLR